MVLAVDESLLRQHWIDPDDVSETAVADAIEFLLDAAVSLSRSRDPSG
jgi:maltooligosyltrehalose synthase